MKSLLLAGTLLVGSASVAHAQSLLFQDSLQVNLNQWVPVAGSPGGSPGYTGSGVIIPALGGGNALTFGVPTYQGDIQTNNSFTSSTGSFTLTFDFLGTCGEPSSCGGFVNASSGAPFVGGWLISDSPYYDPIYGLIPVMPDTGAWEMVRYTFAATSPIYLALETYKFAEFAGSDTAWFKNMSLTDNPTGVPVGTFGVSPVAFATNRFGGVAISDMTGTDMGGTIGETTVTSSQSELTVFEGFISPSPEGDLGRVNFTTGTLSSGSVSEGGVFSSTDSAFSIIGEGKWLADLAGTPPHKGAVTIFSGAFVGPIYWTLVSKIGSELTFTLSGDIAGVWYGQSVTGTVVQNIHTSIEQLGKGIAHISLGDSQLTTQTSIVP